MYAFNNIVAKAEPIGKEKLDSALEAVPRASHKEQVPEVDAAVLYGVLSDDECRELVQRAETVGFTFWAHASADLGEERREGNPSAKVDDENVHRAFRSAYTIEVNLPRLAGLLWDRIQAHVVHEVVFDSSTNPDEFERDCEGHWRAVGLSPNLLFARYDNGGHFAPHVDGSSIADFNHRSFYTVLFYLSTVEEGGETFIMTGDQCQVLCRDTASGRMQGNGQNIVFSVRPVIGTCALFKYNVLHEGAAVSGDAVKYILRGDVMFERTPPLFDAPLDREAFELYQKARVAEAEKRLDEAVRMFQRVRKLSPSIADVYQL